MTPFFRLFPKLLKLPLFPFRTAEIFPDADYLFLRSQVPQMFPHTVEPLPLPLPAIAGGDVGFENGTVNGPLMANQLKNIYPVGRAIS